jgi:outer membrane murein-binding lipoprotein Lpp
MNKDCKSCSDNSSTTYSRCNPPISSNCLFYQGESLTCSNDDSFTICRGDSFTNIQAEIFGKICEIIGDIDVSEVVIPVCLQEAWDKNDLTILNLFNLSLSSLCSQKAEIDQLKTDLDTVNPIVDVNLCCCADSCDTTAVIRLSDALTKIVECVCAARAEAKAAQDTADAANNLVNVLNTKITNLETANCNLIRQQTYINCRLANIESKLDTAGISDCGGTCLTCIPPDPCA